MNVDRKVKKPNIKKLLWIPIVVTTVATAVIVCEVNKKDFSSKTFTNRLDTAHFADLNSSWTVPSVSDAGAALKAAITELNPQSLGELKNMGISGVFDAAKKYNSLWASGQEGLRSWVITKRGSGSFFDDTDNQTKSVDISFVCAGSVGQGFEQSISYDFPLSNDEAAKLAAMPPTPKNIDIKDLLVSLASNNAITILGNSNAPTINVSKLPTGINLSIKTKDGKYQDISVVSGADVYDGNLWDEVTGQFKSSMIYYKITSSDSKALLYDSSNQSAAPISEITGATTPSTSSLVKYAVPIVSTIPSTDVSPIKGSNASKQNKSNNTATIVGATAGGIVGLILIFTIIRYVLAKIKSNNLNSSN